MLADYQLERINCQTKASLRSFDGRGPFGPTYAYLHVYIGGSAAPGSETTVSGFQFWGSDPGLSFGNPYPSSNSVPHVLSSRSDQNDLISQPHRRLYTIGA